MKSGIDVYSSAGTLDALGIKSHRAHALEPEVAVQIGPFKIMAFDVIHDASRPYGYLIHHDETGNILFFTDTGYLSHTFSNINQIIAEANYSEEILEDNIRSGRTPEIMRKRVMGTHMDLRVLLDILAANDLSMTNNIILIHLSDSNSNAMEFKKVIEDATGKNVTVAESGMVLNFNKTPF